MLQDRSPKCYLGALSLLVITIYTLLVLPATAEAASVETTKQEQLQLRELEPKLEAELGVFNGHMATPLNHFGASKRNQRSIGIGPKTFQIPRSRIPIELEMLVDNDEVERPKRFDDYGHMRFGKRGGDENFDDYGHMRFGR